MCSPALAGPPERFWQILALAQGSQQPVSGVRVGPGAVAPVSAATCLGCWLRYSLTSDGLGWLMLRGPMPDLVVVWSWNQAARVLGSVGEKEQEAVESPSRPSSLSSE